MPSNYFKFKQFTILQDAAPFKVGTDGVLLGAWANITNAGKVLDIGTGTGLIALMAAQRSEASITAIEPNLLAYNQALENITNSSFKNRVTLFNSRLQDFSLSDNEKLYDQVISNPPFFNQSLKNQSNDLSQARHTVSLNYADLLKGTNSLLSPDGYFHLILPQQEAALFIDEAVQWNLHPLRICMVYPTPEKEVRRWLMTFTRNQQKTIYEKLIIEKSGRHQYSEEYQQLTRAFYLNF